MNTPSAIDATTNRKARHLSICSDPHKYQVEGGSTGFKQVHFIHQALPELDARKVDTKTAFVDQEVSYPFFISCMTGGSEDGFRANRNLARAAQEANIPVGTGSIRVLFEKDDVFEHFHLKPWAKDVPVMANIGGVQLRDINRQRIIEMVKRLEVQALVVHLNPGQELFQPDGDRDFRGIEDALHRYCALSPIPVIVKETGFGITPGLMDRLVKAGVAYVDVAGAGGTNWISVEAYRSDRPAEQRSAAEFEEWGLPTACILACLGEKKARILASGGIRTGMDIAKSLAMGADLAGLALPFVRAEADGGIEQIGEHVAALGTTLRKVMVLTGSRTVEELKRAPLWYDGDFSRAVESIRAAGQIGPPPGTDPL